MRAPCCVDAEASEGEEEDEEREEGGEESARVADCDGERWHRT